VPDSQTREILVPKRSQLSEIPSGAVGFSSKKDYTCKKKPKGD